METPGQANQGTFLWETSNLILSTQKYILTPKHKMINDEYELQSSRYAL